MDLLVLNWGFLAFPPSSSPLPPSLSSTAYQLRRRVKCELVFKAGYVDKQELPAKCRRTFIRDEVKYQAAAATEQ